MSGKQARAAFTLIEVLIVVVIMAVLAATVIPQFSSSTKDAKESTLKFNLHSLRSQLELYKLHHLGATPDGTNDLEQLTKATNASGVIGTPGTSFPYGPYCLNTIAVNPFTSSYKVRLDTGAAGTVPAASGANDAGWIYRASTGELWADHPDYISIF